VKVIKMGGRALKVSLVVALFGCVLGEYPLSGYGGSVGGGGHSYGYDGGYGHQGHHSHGEAGGYGPEVHYQPAVAKVQVEKHVDYYVSLFDYIIELIGCNNFNFFQSHPKYSYSYGVLLINVLLYLLLNIYYKKKVKDAHTGDYKSAHETRDGGVVKGS
jgi:hypothetical protein